MCVPVGRAALVLRARRAACGARTAPFLTIATTDAVAQRSIAHAQITAGEPPLRTVLIKEPQLERRFQRMQYDWFQFHDRTLPCAQVHGRYTTVNNGYSSSTHIAFSFLYNSWQRQPDAQPWVMVNEPRGWEYSRGLP